MTYIESLRAKETALLADRARVDEALLTVRAAIAGAEALAAEARAHLEASREADPEPCPT